MNLLFVLLVAIPFLKIALTIIIVGFLLWLVTVLIPMNDIIQKILIAVVIIGLVIWVLQACGVKIF